MRDQAPYLTYALKVVLRPEALLLWAALFYLLSFLKGLRAHWGDAAVLALAAVAARLGRARGPTFR